jgi:hypothetical protein
VVLARASANHLLYLFITFNQKSYRFWFATFLKQNGRMLAHQPIVYITIFRLGERDPNRLQAYSKPPRLLLCLK